MIFTSIGDLANGLVLRSRNAQLKHQMTRLSQEVTTGRASDTARHLGGHLSFLAQVEHDLELVGTFRISASEARITGDAMQNALTRIQDETGKLAQTVALASTLEGPPDLRFVATQARGSLEAMVSSLNSGVGGRHIFAGVDVDVAPIALADVIYADVKAAISTEISAADVLTAADAYFDTPGGGFETTIYQGATVNLAPLQLGEGEAVSFDLRADHAALRSAMKHTVLAALVNDTGLALSETARRDLLHRLTEGLFTGQSQITAIRADLGFAEERVARAQSRLGSEAAGLELAQSKLVSIDPYESATELESVQVQLETLYTITARTSRLNLVSFLS